MKPLTHFKKLHSKQSLDKDGIDVDKVDASKTRKLIKMENQKQKQTL